MLMARKARTYLMNLKVNEDETRLSQMSTLFEPPGNISHMLTFPIELTFSSVNISLRANISYLGLTFHAVNFSIAIMFLTSSTFSYRQRNISDIANTIDIVNNFCHMGNISLRGDICHRGEQAFPIECPFHIDRIFPIVVIFLIELNKLSHRLNISHRSYISHRGNISLRDGI